MGLPLRPIAPGMEFSAILTLGTAGLSAPYAAQLPPSKEDGVRIIRAAIDGGVNWIDTAPDYQSEWLIEKALRHVNRRDVVRVSTKVNPRFSSTAVASSIELSRIALKRMRLDLVYLHNPTVADITEGRAIGVLNEAKAKGKIKLIGASVYTVAEALAAINAGLDVIQVPYNIFDQRMGAVLDSAIVRGCHVVARSIWLRGALCGAPGVPSFVADRVTLTRRCLVAWAALPEIALRFAMGLNFSSLVIGPRSVNEVNAALAMASRGVLGGYRSWVAKKMATVDPLVIDPRTWDAR